jgi:hypothetical protein
MSEPIGEDVVMSVLVLMLLVSVEAAMLPVSVDALMEVSVLVDVVVVVSVVVAGSSSVSSFLHPANGSTRMASRQRSERRTESFFICFLPC